MLFIIVFLLVFNVAFVLSPFLYQFSYIGLLSIISLAVICFLLSMQYKKEQNLRIILGFCIIISLSFVVSGLFWQDFGLVHYPKFLIVSLLIAVFTSHEVKIVFIKWFTLFMFLQLAFAIVGFLYAAVGGLPTLEVTIGTGRAFPLYLTSFSVTQYANFIRPSGLFDEPGTLSFLICFLVTIREANGFKRNVNYILLTLGFITLSLAHILFALVYIFYSLLIIRSRGAVLWLLVCSCAVLFLAQLLPNAEFIFEYYLSRANSDTSGSGRSMLFNTALEQLKTAGIEEYIFGISSYCLTDYTGSCRYLYPRMGENILSPLVFGGLISAWPFYLISMFSFALACYKPSTFIIFFAFIALYFQRPYVFNISYALMFAFVFIEIINLVKNSKKIN